MRKGTGILGLAVLAVAGVVSAGVDVVLVDGRRIAATAVERRGEVYVLDLPGGGRTTLPLSVVDGLRFSVGDVPVPEAGSPRVEIALTDGRILDGIALERREGLYLLTRRPGETVSLPEDLVLAVRLSEPSSPPARPARPRRNDPEPADRARPPSSVDADDAVKAPDAPPRARTLPSSRPPSRTEQLAVFGDASVFPVPRIPTWRPRGAYGEQRNAAGFRPTTWRRAPYDPTWTPQSSFRSASALPDFNTTRWYRAAHDWRWRPSDGWIRASGLAPE